MLEKGKKIGEYELIELIGSGAFGDVWKAEKRTALDVNYFALKFFRPKDKEVDLEKIRKEIGVWKQLRGLPHIISVTELDQFENYIYVVSEFAEGGSLAEWLKDKGGKAKSIEEAIKITLEILSGLENLHDKGFVHRDLKPDNILIMNGKHCLADFGISREIKTHSKSTATAGTLEYMSPEAFDNKVSFQSDIWAVGVILQELLSGKLPFDEETPQSLMMAIVTKEPQLISQELPKDLRNIVKKALEKDRNERYQTAKEMRGALQEFLRNPQGFVEEKESQNSYKQTIIDEDLEKITPPTPKESKTKKLEIPKTENRQNLKKAPHTKKQKRPNTRSERSGKKPVNNNYEINTLKENKNNFLKVVVSGAILALIVGFIGIYYLSSLESNSNGDFSSSKNKNLTKDKNKKNTSPNKAVESSVTIEARDGKYTITGVVNSEKQKADILAKAEKTWDKGNVNVYGLKVDAKAKPFKEGWWDGFEKLLPDLKDWKDGAISWVGDFLRTRGEIPGAIADKIKSLFSDWSFGGPTDSVKKPVKDNTKKIKKPVKDVARKLTSITLLGGTKLDAYPGGIEEQLVKFIKSNEYKNANADDLKTKWFNFDDLKFKFGTTEITPESKRQLDNIVAILKAYPDVKIKIGGYTDKKGDDDANKKLSDDRAKAVKAVLEKAGVGSQVPEAEGYGELFAKVSENASAEERAKDRRISIRLLK